MEYRRVRIKGGRYFFTVVTYKRERILTQPGNIAILRQAFTATQNRYSFIIDAIVILPDHLHCVWTMPEGEQDYSIRWRLIKTMFTRGCDKTPRHKRNTSRESKKEQGVWQRRFWEHCIRDEKDYIAHIEYIHYNPVRHGLVKSPKSWPYSSFHRFVTQGIYEENWGAELNMQFDDTIGRE